MTQEQLEFFAEEAERAAEKGARRGVEQQRRRGTAAFVGLLIAVGANFWLLNNSNDRQEKASTEAREAIVASGRAVSVDGCNRDYGDRVKFRNLLLRLKISAKGNPATTPAQKKTALEFYDKELANYPLIDCRNARNVVTDDPNATPETPDPYYPGNPRAPKEVDLPSG